MYDVQWSPTHPAVFASVDGDGRLDFWNINSDTEVGSLPPSLTPATISLSLLLGACPR